MNNSFPSFGARSLTGLLALAVAQAHHVDASGRSAISPFSISGRSLNSDELHATITDDVRRLALRAAVGLSPRLNHRINELSELHAGWDGERAKPVKPHALADAVESIKRLSARVGAFQDPFIAPTFDGRVQLEWVSGNRSLDLELIADGWSAVGTEVKNGESNYLAADFDRNDFSSLANFYQWVFSEDKVWPSS